MLNGRKEGGGSPLSSINFVQLSKMFLFWTRFGKVRFWYRLWKLKIPSEITFSKLLGLIWLKNTGFMMKQKSCKLDKIPGGGGGGDPIPLLRGVMKMSLDLFWPPLTWKKKRWKILEGTPPPYIAILMIRSHTIARGPLKTLKQQFKGISEDVEILSVFKLTYVLF